MNKSVKIILIAIMLLAVVFAVTACVTPATEIAVSGSPQVMVVKGNDLDLSAIKLAVTQGNSSSELALNAEGVEVTGYDKNTAGEQTLTITYDGATTTLNVTVIERMVAFGHVADYVVGDNFENTGSLKITKDNGESFSVRLNDEKVQLSGFDSSAAGEKTVNVTYTDGSLVLNGSFNVNVWNSDNVQLVFPTKRIYDSHETEINLIGGSLTVTANSGAVTRYLPLKADWIQGFNPDVVTEETPSCRQTITVAYPGQSVTYTIDIYLSDITRIQRTAATLSNLDWSGETPCEITDEQGQSAMRALALYNDLNKYDAMYISDEDTLNVVRTAAVYGAQKWTDSANQFTGLFNARLHSLSLNCDKADETKTQFEAISALEEDSPLFTYGDILIKALDNFGDQTVYGEETFSNYVKDVCDGETVKTAISKIDLMLKMHEALADVPADWQVSDLQTPETSAKIEQAVEHTVALSEITDSITERFLFNNVSQWRPENKNDYFEILYRYYFAMYLSDDQEAQLAGVQGIDNLIDVCMPGILETYYLQYIVTLMEQYDLQYTTTEDGYLQQPANNIDTTSFIVAYRSLLQIRQSIYDTEDEMYITLFEEYTLNNIIYQIQTADIGAFSIFGSANGDIAFDNIWTKYLDVIIAIGNTSDDDNLGQLIEELFAEFVSLTPELQSQFLASLNPYGWPDFDVDDGTGESTMFAGLIISYYLDTLPQSFFNEENGIVSEMFYAFQWYMYRYESLDEDNLTGINLFVLSMQDVQTMYNALTGEDKTAFDSHIGFFYEKLSYIYSLYNEEGNFVENEITEDWAAKLTELEGAYGTLYTLFLRAAYYGDITCYPVFISAYEYTVDLYNYIIAEAPQDVADKVLYGDKVVLFAGEEDLETELKSSYEAVLYTLRWIYIDMLLEYPVDDQYVITAWEEYTSTNLREYFAYLLDFYSAVTVDDGQVTDEMVKAVMSGFQNLTDDEKALFVAMDGYGQLVYYKGLGAYFYKKFENSASATELVEDIINIEINCAVSYTVQEFIDAWKAVQDAYEALSEEDKALFDEVLKDTYDYYNGIYIELSGELTPSEDNAQA